MRKEIREMSALEAIAVAALFMAFMISVDGLTPEGAADRKLEAELRADSGAYRATPAGKAARDKSREKVFSFFCHCAGGIAVVYRIWLHYS
jgi:hypothetical protein